MPSPFWQTAPLWTVQKQRSWTRHRLFPRRSFHPALPRSSPSAVCGVALSWKYTRHRQICKSHFPYIVKQTDFVSSSATGSKPLFCPLVTDETTIQLQCQRQAQDSVPPFDWLTVCFSLSSSNSPGNRCFFGDTLLFFLCNIWVWRKVSPYYDSLQS